MELKEFLIKFLPDYEAKLTEVKGDTNDEKVMSYLFWQQTRFGEKIKTGVKLHTVKTNYEYWKKEN